MSELFKNRIAGIEEMTLLDYEGHLSCILFYNGCNLRCPYCYNGDLACGKAKNMDGNEIISFLINRVGKLDSVVFSGGECTIHGENLKNDIYFVKDLGYNVKVDTNGSNPELVKDLIESKEVAPNFDMMLKVFLEDNINEMYVPDDGTDNFLL